MQNLDFEFKVVLDFFIYGNDQKIDSDQKSSLLLELVEEYIPSLGCAFQEKFNDFDARVEYAYRSRKEEDKTSWNSTDWCVLFLKDLVVKVNTGHNSVILMHNFICVKLVLGVAKRFLSKDQLYIARREIYRFMLSYLQNNFTEYIETSGGFQAILEKRKKDLLSNYRSIGSFRYHIIHKIISICRSVRATFYFIFENLFR